VLKLPDANLLEATAKVAVRFRGDQAMIVSVIVATGAILVISVLLIRRARGTPSEALQEELRQRYEDEGRRLADMASPSPTDGDTRLTQQPEPDPKPEEQLTDSPSSAADRSRCPACGASITANDESCPSCKIAFVADGPQKWTLGPVGPADAIYRPTTEITD